MAGLGNDLLDSQVVLQLPYLRDGIMVSTATVGGLVAPTSPMSLLNAQVSTLLNYPYRLSFSLYRGSIYVADFYNKAVRRFYVQPQCACAEVSAAPSLNPTPLGPSILG